MMGKINEYGIMGKIIKVTPWENKKLGSVGTSSASLLNQED